MWNCQSYDELDSGEHQVDGTRHLIYILFIHRCIIFFVILTSQVRCYCIQYLLSFIVTMYWTKFLYELYSNSRVLVYYIEGHLFFVSIIGCHNCSYSAILKSFLYLQIQLYDTFSLSLLHVHWIYCARSHGIHIYCFKSN